MNSLKFAHLLFFVFCYSLASSQVIYVKVNGTGDGSSWANAESDLQVALSNVSPGSQIWIAGGTYYPVSCNPCSEEQRSISFTIPNGVAVYGGFAGTEISLSQRDWETNISILSGDINQDQILTNNAQTIISFSNVSSSTILDGFVLENGYAYSSNPSSGEKYNSGGAIYNSGVLNNNVSEPVIRNCIIRNNEASAFGGAIYNNGGFTGNANSVFENCTFLDNVSQEAGGAIYNQGSFSGNASCEFTNCIFSNNSAMSTGGGAVFNQGAEDGDASAAFIECYFEENQVATGYGGAVHNHGRGGTSNTTFNTCTFIDNFALFGGAVSSNGTNEGVANPSFVNCHFEENHSGGDGGSVYNWGSEGQSDAYFFNSTFERNNSTFAGAGVFNNGIDGESNATIINCKFIENIADTYGGAVYNNGKRGFSDASIINCLFLNNTGNSAGGIYNLGGEGGHSNAEVTNCTFYGNSANVGGAIYSNASDSTGTSNPIITNCIFWKNEANFGSVFRNILASPLIQYSVVDRIDCESLNSGEGSEVVCGETVLFNSYPEFMDTINFNLRLKANSPVLDLGNNVILNDIDFDLDNQDRIENGTVDFGAFEYVTPVVFTSIITQPQSNTLCAGDSLLLNIEVEGTAPFTYQWLKDGELIQGATESSYGIPEVITNDAGAYTCIVHSPVDSIVSDFATISIDPLLMPAIAIIVNGQEICSGQALTLPTGVVNAGQNPTYNWFLNGNPISGNVNVLELENLSTESWIVVTLESSETCIASDIIISDSIQISVNPLLTPSVDILEPDTSVCIGNIAEYKTDISNAGSNPSFQWIVNDVEVDGATAETFTTNELQFDDEIKCQMMSSELCLLENPVVSDIVFASLDSCNLVSTSEVIDNRFISVNPNPSSGLCTLEVNNLVGRYTLQLVDLSGGIIKEKVLELNGGNNNNHITIQTNGIYFLRFFNEYHFYTQKIIIEK